MRTRAAILGLLLSVAASAHAQKARILVDASQILNRVSPWLAGSCIEDVNHEIYGGLYDQKVFGESFEEPPPGPKFTGWRILGGEWASNGNGISVGASDGGKLESETSPFGDGSVSTEVRFLDDDGTNAGLLLRLSNAGIGADTFDGYEISLDRSAQRVILGKHQQNWQPLASKAVAFNPREWTRLKAQIIGARIRIFVGESATAAIDYTDSNAPLPLGSFGLRTWKSKAAFRAVTLEKLGEVPVSVPLGALDAAPLSVSSPWDALQHGTALATLSRVTDRPYNGAWCQKIERGAGTGDVGVANQGLNRWGIAVKRGESLGGRLYLRAKGLRGPVTITLQSADGRRTYAVQKISGVGAQWKKFPLSLKPNSTDLKARLAITIDQPGTLWIDQVTLSGTGAAQFKGLPVRADIARQIQAQGIKFLRYGGTMVNAPEYRWKKMIGDPDKRPPYRGHWYPYSTNAFGFEEFLRFCEAAGFEPAFAVNVEETAQDAADLVEYLNGGVDTPWGRRRAQNGHPAPYRVKWIELGNEEVIWGDNAADYYHYIERFKALSAVMLGKDRGLQLVCAAWWRPESPSMERVFKELQGKAAYWDLHVWSDDARAGTIVDRDLTQMRALFKKWVPDSTMKCVILEENGNLHNQQRALGHATTLNAVRRHGDFVVASCPANALQPIGQNDNGWDQGQIFFSPDQVWGMPPFYAAQMAASNHQPLRVQSTADGALDVTATRSEDGNLVLHVVNASDAAQTTLVSIGGISGLRGTAERWTLAGAPEAVNSATKTRVQSVHDRISLAGKNFESIFPANSYTILRLSAAGR